MNPRGWLVVAADGFEAVFRDRAAAEKYAVCCRGVVFPLEVPAYALPAPQPTMKEVPA